MECKDWLSENYPTLLKRCVARVGEEHASDVLHNAVESLLKHEGDIDYLPTFMDRCIRTSVIDHYREETKHREIDGSSKEEAVNEVGAERQAICNEDTQQVVKMIRMIPNKKHRKALQLILLEGQEYSEVSYLTGLSEPNLRKIVERFRKRM